MNFPPVLTIREKPTQGIIDLLDSTVLGTNGARYRHKDIRSRIEDADNPLYLSIEVRNKVLGNITFCRRGTQWYVRYFAFDQIFQSAGSKKRSGRQGNSVIKKELDNFFESAFNGHVSGELNSMYAYIDPKNTRSLWMSESFGFTPIGTVATQTFSRTHPKSTLAIEQVTNWESVQTLLEDTFAKHDFYFKAQLAKGPFYIARNAQGKVIACCKISEAIWEIERFPGIFGVIPVATLRFIPFLRKVLNPANHQFLVPEAIFIQENDPKLFVQFMNAILVAEKKNVMMWWVDEVDFLYQAVRSKVRWGLLHRLIGINQAVLVERKKPGSLPDISHKSPFYTCGFDFI